MGLPSTNNFYELPDPNKSVGTILISKEERARMFEYYNSHPDEVMRNARRAITKMVEEEHQKHPWKCHSSE